MKNRFFVLSLILLSCFPQKPPLNVDMFVVKDGNGFRVVGFIPAEYIREGAYIPTLMFPKRLVIIVGDKEFPIYADVLALTLDKQKKFKKAFLVSERFNYKGEEEFRIVVFKGNFKVGEIYGNLRVINPSYKIRSIEKVKMGDYWHVYVDVKFIPAAKSYPKLLAVYDGKADTFLPIEVAPFLTKYLGREDFKYRGWYDEWKFVKRFKEKPDLGSVNWTILGDIFGDSL